LRSKEEVDDTGRRAIDAAKVVRVVKALMRSNKPATEKNLREQVVKTLGEKDPKPFGEQLEAEVKRAMKWSLAFEALEESAFLDADAEYKAWQKRASDFDRNAKEAAKESKQATTAAGKKKAEERRKRNANEAEKAKKTGAESVKKVKDAVKGKLKDGSAKEIADACRAAVSA
jgi:hypothetical protein